MSSVRLIAGLQHVLQHMEQETVRAIAQEAVHNQRRANVTKLLDEATEDVKRMQDPDAPPPAPDSFQLIDLLA